jgi:hypothetical protein
VWTPNGYLYVDGYWEQPFDMRGLAFAPIYFNDPIYTNPGWNYRPTYALNLGAFLNSAFVGPGGGFYFGNYYSPYYARNGFNPWYNGRGRYDPLFAYYQSGNPNWLANQQQLYGQRLAGTAVAPPLGLVQQNALVAAKKANPVVTPLNQLGGQNIGLVNIAATQAAAQQAIAQQTRNIAVNRQIVESIGATMATPSSQVRTVRQQSFLSPTQLGTPTAPMHSPASDPRGLPHGPGGGSTSSSQPFGNLNHGMTLPYGNMNHGTTPGIKIINSQPTINNNTFPKVTNTLPQSGKVSNTLPTMPFARTVVPPAGVTNNMGGAGPQINQWYSPATSSRPVAPAPVTRTYTPAPATRMASPAPHISAAPRMAPAPHFAPAPHMGGGPRIGGGGGGGGRHR